MDHHAYKHHLRDLQLALVRWQGKAIADGQKVVVVLEGRDGAGKDGSIKRITEHLSTRATRVVALPKPSDRERSLWFFQRDVEHLPACGELVIFNRSWYNRAGVEPVMGFCTDQEHRDFLRDAPQFERMLTEAGVVLLKYWLDISKAEQGRRLDARRSDPLKTLKVSDLDGLAQTKWKAYSAARDEMLARTHSDIAPWWCVATDHKKEARINLMRHLVRHLSSDDAAAPPGHDVLFRFEPEVTEDGRLAK
jgi:polyphosphate kinase 2